MKAKLFVQGGGMRGLYSLAVLARLEELNLRDDFATVEGASAGAINGAYFIAGQACDAVGIYTEMLTSKKFIKYSRLGKILDIDFMVDSVLKQEYPLRVSRYWDSETEMRTILCNASTAQEFVVTNRMRDVDVYELFRATAALPLLYHKKVLINGVEYVDGGVSRALPTMADLTQGRPLLVVLTRPLRFRAQPPRAIVKAALALRARSVSTAVYGEILRNYGAFNETMQFIEKLDRDSPVRVIAPRDVKLIASRTTRNRDLLKATIQAARDDVERSLDRA